MTRKELKALARMQIEGKIASLFLLTLVISLLTSIFGYLPTVGRILSIILSAAMSLGLIYVHFRIASDTS